MTSEVMREKFNITQRPADPRTFLVSDIANALGISEPFAYRLVVKLQLSYTKLPDGRGHNVIHLSYDALARCREELERRENAEKAKREIGRAELEAAQAEHPLVTDPRFLKLSYFPDVTPACFSEVE